MANGLCATLGQLLGEFDVVVEKILQRLKQEFQPKERNELNFLFQTHVERRLHNLYSKFLFKEFPPKQLNERIVNKLDVHSELMKPVKPMANGSVPLQPLRTKNQKAIIKSNFQTETTKPEKPIPIGSFMFSCYYCDDQNMWNENLNKILEHWAKCHRWNAGSQFLFHVIFENNDFFNLFKYTAITNGQLKRLWSIENPWKQHHSNSEPEKAANISKNVRYLLCGECEMKLSDNEYFKHIEQHANELRAKKIENDLKTHLKSMHSKTKVIFSNGLVLTKYNLSKTYLGDDDIFGKFINKLPIITTEETGLTPSPTTDAYASNQILTNDSNGSPTSISDSSHEVLTQLKLQKQQMNTLCIFDIPQRDGESLNEIFLKICRCLRISIEYEVDVLEVFRASPKVIAVKFNETEKKNEILKCGRLMCLSTQHIFDDEPTDRSRRIKFNNHVTKFYERIERHLKHAMEQGKIHAFKLTQDGFKLKKSENSGTKTVMSIDEFEKIMNNER